MRVAKTRRQEKCLNRALEKFLQRKENVWFIVGEEDEAALTESTDRTTPRTRDMSHLIIWEVEADVSTI